MIVYSIFLLDRMFLWISAILGYCINSTEHGAAAKRWACLSTLLNRRIIIITSATSSGRCLTTRTGWTSSLAPVATLGLLILIPLLILTLKGTKVGVLSLRRSLPRGRLQYLINQSVPNGLVRRQIKISLHVLPALLGSLTGHLGKLHVEIVVHLLHILHLQGNVGGLSLEGTFHTNPLKEEPRVGQRAAAALGTGASEEGTHAGAQTDVDGGDLTVLANLSKEIVDGQTRSEKSAGNVEVEGDGTSGILLAQVQDGGNDGVGVLLVNKVSNEEDAIADHAVVDANKLGVVRTGWLHNTSGWGWKLGEYGEQEVCMAHPLKHSTGKHIEKRHVLARKRNYQSQRRTKERISTPFDHNHH